jgi:hypothetical protein
MVNQKKETALAEKDQAKPDADNIIDTKAADKEK